MQVPIPHSRKFKFKTLFSEIFCLGSPVVLNVTEFPHFEGAQNIPPTFHTSESHDYLSLFRDSAVNNTPPSPRAEKAHSPPRHENEIHNFFSPPPISAPLPPVGTPGSSAIGSVTGLFPNARGVVMNSPLLVWNAQGERNIVIQGRLYSMKALSRCSIKGAEYNSSLRDPPPRCHPGTRVLLHEKINAWFHNEGRTEAYLWLSGPAGVGKSAVIQTFAESLAESRCLGASLFFSKLNGRRDPQRVFVTVAFQLATRLHAYRAYITERIALDPSLMNKGMEEQFKTFIAEPFGSQSIGVEHGPWGVLLDGLDECEGVYEQCKIIQLISAFVLRYPRSPLVWTIASRPEPHIVTAFKDGAVALSHWTENIPINSLPACQDVEHYLNASLEDIRRQFPLVPPNWPNESQFLGLANGASGLFVFARTAVRFMEDPAYADPVSRLDLILSVINSPDAKMTENNPFAPLDALYTQILESVPPTVWETTKRVLGFILCTVSPSRSTNDGLSYPLRSRSLFGASIILSLAPSVTYGSLHKLHSVLDIPDPIHGYHSTASFFHTSFADYLTNSTRSKAFWIDRGESVDEIAHDLYRLYLSKPWENGWIAYTSWPLIVTRDPFYRILELDARSNLDYVATGKLKTQRGRGPFVSQKDRSECMGVLREINVAELYRLSKSSIEITDFLFDLYKAFPEELAHLGLCKQLPLRELQLHHLNYESAELISIIRVKKARTERSSPLSPNALQHLISELKSLRQNFPGAFFLVCGSTPEKRNAFVYLEGKSGFTLLGPYFERRCYCIPYPF